MKLTKRFDTNLKLSEGERSVVARISTASVDREGDVVLPSGVELDEFKQNPVVLFGHDSAMLPIGKAEGITTTRNAVIAKVKFAERPKAHPTTAEWVPDTIHSLFQQGVLRAFSVGFSVPNGGIRDADEKDIGRLGDDVRRVITRWKLLEFSVVPIPANQDALATAVSKGILSTDDWTFGALEIGLDSDKYAPIALSERQPMHVIISGRN